MDYGSHEADIALEVAHELAGEYGEAVVAEVEKRLNSAGEGRRSFEGTVSEAAAVASVIIGCIQVYLQYRSDQQFDEFLTRLEDEAPEPDQLTQEKRLGIIKRVLAKLTSKPTNDE
jgi:hypothetical protein